MPADVLQSLLRHPDPGIRASVCGCARRRPELISVMIDLLEDLNQGVARSAALLLDKSAESKLARCWLSCCEKIRQRN
jgi:hypothetical protein